ncbi:tetratricopeptide repeat protein [bacterium]|nr:tetratricopeptide repeat protein [bacterium]
MIETNKTGPVRLKGKRGFFYIIMVTLPLVFLIVLEVSLRIANYGSDTGQWVKQGDKTKINPNLAFRYFNNIKTPPSTIEDIFDTEKKENAYRIFILGGSTAAGFPYMPMGSFSRYIRKRLEMNCPQKTIEVVNIAMAAVNSYTIRDLMPGVIGQKPDLILIYTGHNEYYGAYGVASAKSVFGSVELIHMVLILNRFRTTQLIRNLICRVTGKPESDGASLPGTLMARMAGKKAIEYQSPDYYKGIDQFRKNMRAVIRSCNKAGVPLLLGTLTCNTKDQKPFSDFKSSRHPSAKSVYEKALGLLSDGKSASADSLFTLAKDLDAIRFRAPSDINQVIRDLAGEFDVHLVNVDSAFRAESDDRIVGDRWMTDHLHPTLEGYQLMGRAYYETMHDRGLLPDDVPFYAFDQQDSLTRAYFMITDLDKRIGDFSIVQLKNDWPYIDPSRKRKLEDLIHCHDETDSMSLLVVQKKKKWQNAHIDLAKNALRHHDIETYLRHMDVLIYQYPSTAALYDSVIRELLALNKPAKALPYLVMRHKLGPDAFISKWTGIAFLAWGHAEWAIQYLEESIRLDPADAQAWYHLGAACILDGQYDKAHQMLKRCLEIDPAYPGAAELLHSKQTAG